MLRFDGAIARFWAARYSKDGDPSPLMPWPKHDPEPASAEQVMALLKSSVKKKD